MHYNHAICLRVFWIEHKSIGKLILSLNRNGGRKIDYMCVQARAIHVLNTILFVIVIAIASFCFYFLYRNSINGCCCCCYSLPFIHLAEVKILHFFLSLSFSVKQNTETWKYSFAWQALKVITIVNMCCSLSHLSLAKWLHINRWHSESHS